MISGGDAVTAHDPATGKEFWRVSGLNPQHRGDYRVVASPVLAGGLIVSPSRNNPLTAIRPGGTRRRQRARTSSGRSSAARTCRRRSATASISTWWSKAASCTAWTLMTGAMVYGPERLPNDFYSASPVLADGKIYVTGETQGITTVFRAGPKFEILSSNSLGDPCTPYCLSSVAVSEGQLFIRLSTALWAIGDERRVNGAMGAMGQCRSECGSQCDVPHCTRARGLRTVSPIASLPHCPIDVSESDPEADSERPRPAGFADES